MVTLNIIYLTFLTLGLLFAWLLFLIWINLIKLNRK